jgi:hypothetical protein
VRHFFGQLLFVFYAEIFWRGSMAVLQGFLRKTCSGRDVFVVKLWWNVWQRWVLDVSFRGAVFFAFF